MGKIKISDSDKRLLIIFFAIVLVACSYFFIFNKGMNKASEQEAQNNTDSTKVQQMETMEAGLPQVKENIQTMRKKQKKIIANYPSDMTTEKVIETLQAIEDGNESEFHISEITFLMNNPIQVAATGTTDANTAAATEEDTSSDSGTTSTESQDTQAADNSGDADSSDNAQGLDTQVNGYYASIGIKYKANYTGLKDMINYVNTFADRTTITDFSATYDSETGGLTGEMTLNMYYLTNTGKDYVPPVFENMTKGTINIFGGSAD